MLLFRLSLVDQLAFDGMRKHLSLEFEHIDHVDLHGNVRRNPKLSGTVHNVFGIQVGVGITLAVKKKGAMHRLRYHRVPEMWRKGEKLQFLAKGEIAWQTLTPDDRYSWLVPEHADEYRGVLAIEDLFDLHTIGVKTNRDDVVYGWDQKLLTNRMRQLIADYRTEVFRHKAEPNADWPDNIKWSEGLKLNVARGNLTQFDADKFRTALYRPFAKKSLYFDRILIDRVLQWPNISALKSICVTAHSQVPFSVLMADVLPNEAVGGRQGQCFPLSQLKDSAVAQYRQRYSDDSLTKEQVFHYLYALLHH